MTNDGIRLQLKGTTFKFELLQIVSGVFEAAAKTFVALKTGGASLAVAPNLVTGLFGALKGVKLEQNPEHRAWLLVSGGLLYAIEKSVSEVKLTSVPPPEAFKQLMQDLGTRIQTRTYSIEPDFFSFPHRLVLLDDAAHELAAWASKYGGKDKPNGFRRKLEKHFASGLHRTWMKSSAHFEPLEQALNSPFAASVRTQQEFDGYLQYLEEQFTQLRLIGQDQDDPKAVTIPQVFVPLRGYVEEKIGQRPVIAGLRKTETPDGLTIESGSQTRKRVTRFFDELDEWLKLSDRRDALRIVSGGPGIGKSTTMRAFAARAARSGVVFPILIPLQKLERPDQPLRDRIKEYLVNTREIPFKSSPLDADGVHKSCPFLLIFDGLDELVRPGKDADDVARDFMMDMRGLLEQQNGQVSHGRAEVLAVVTGRLASAESAARAMKYSGDQVIFLLPFAVDEAGRRESPKISDPDKLLQIDQRLEWWEQWRRATDNVPEKIPERLLHSDLFEVTVEPLLLYFIAFVRPWESTSLVQGNFDRNWLYDRLLKAFYARECDKGIRNFALEFGQFEYYEIVLQAMALTAWYDGSTRTGTIEVVEKLLKSWDEDAASAFNKVVGNEKPAVGAALAFYMKPGERPNSFEFLHKTFAEYLVSRRFVDTIDYFSSTIKEASVGRISRRRGPEFGSLLAEWLRFSGSRAMDRDLLRFLNDEVARRYKEHPHLVIEWRSAATSCLRVALRDGFPTHALLQLRGEGLAGQPQTFRDLIDQCRNAEESLLAILHATILPSIEESGYTAVRLAADEKDGSTTWMLSRIRGPRAGSEFVALGLLDGLDFSNEDLGAQDFIRCRAKRSNFSNASLWQANLRGATLDGSDFRNASLICATFANSSLGGAIFDGSESLFTNFQSAMIDNASFVDAVLEQTSMRHASLSGVDFSKSQIKKVDFTGANLARANFKGAKLLETNFYGADLTGAIISKSQLAQAKKTDPREPTEVVMPEE